MINNTLAVFALRMWGLIISLVMLPFIINHIGIERYGIYFLVYAITGYFGHSSQMTGLMKVASFGIGASIPKFIPEFLAKNDKEMVNKVINTTFFIYAALGIIVASIMFIFGTFFLSVFNIPSEFIGEARTVTYLAGISTFFAFSFGCFPSVIKAMEKFMVNSIISFIVSTNPGLILAVAP